MRATSSVDSFHTSVDMEDAVLAHRMQIHLFSLGRQHNQTPLYFHLGFSVLWFTGICAKALITGFVQGEILRELVLWYFAGVTYKYHRIMEKLELEGTHKDQFITRIYCCWFIACVCFLNNSLNCMTSKCIEHSWWEIEHCEYKSLDGFKTMDIFLYLFEFYLGNNSLKKKPKTHSESFLTWTLGAWLSSHKPLIWRTSLVLGSPAPWSSREVTWAPSISHCIRTPTWQRQDTEKTDWAWTCCTQEPQLPLHSVFLSILNHAGVWFACWWLTYPKSSLTYKNRKSHQIV